MSESLIKVCCNVSVDDGKPHAISPTLERTQRTRTGSIHRKRKQGQTNTQPSEPPVISLLLLG